MKKTVKLLAAILSLVLVFSAFAIASSAATPTKAVVVAADTEVMPGDSLEVTVSANAAMNFTNIEFSVIFDASAVKLDDVTIGAAMPSVNAYNPVGTNTVKFAGASATAKSVAAGAAFAVLTFDVDDAIADNGDYNIAIKVVTNKLNNNGTPVFDSVEDAAISVVVKHTHSFDDYNAAESKAPECEEDGFDRYYCACGEHKDTPISQTGHDFNTKNDAETKAPKCEEDGFDRFYCACGEYKDTPIPQTGHDFNTKNDAESKAPQCEEDGFDRFYCACGEYKDVTVPQTGHNHATVWTPVAGMDGWYEMVCSGCSKSIKTYLPADVTNDAFGATVSVDKGAFGEVVTPVISELGADEAEDVVEAVSDYLASYMFKVDFLDAAGNSVDLATGTKYTLSLDILDAVAGYDYDVAIYDPATNKLVKLSDKVDGNEVIVEYGKSAIFVVYGGEEVVGPSEDPVTPPATGDNSSISIAIAVMIVAILAAGTSFVLKKKKA